MPEAARVDIVRVLDEKIERLPLGDYTKGLKAVRLHIDAAIGHLRRGEVDGDTGAFTDAIYRCNQAFEGSVKEAYRVLANKPPEKLTPAKIEAFLSSGDVLRKRVLDQFTNYRTEWRNPSTHDYMLDFDENEALLAIVSVTVFAAVLCDQMDTKIAADLAQQSAVPPAEPVPATTPLIAEVTERVIDFARTYADGPSGPTEAARHLEGSLAGQLASDFSTSPDVSVVTGFRLEGREADIAVRRDDEIVAVEVKRMQRPIKSVIFSGLAYLSDLLGRGFSDGVLLLYLDGDDGFSLREIKNPEGQVLRAVFGDKVNELFRSGDAW